MRIFRRLDRWDFWLIVAENILSEIFELLNYLPLLSLILTCAPLFVPLAPLASRFLWRLFR